MKPENSNITRLLIMKCCTYSNNRAVDRVLRFNFQPLLKNWQILYIVQLTVSTMKCLVVYVVCTIYLLKGKVLSSDLCCLSSSTWATRPRGPLGTPGSLAPNSFWINFSILNILKKFIRPFVMLHPYMENRDAGFELMSVATYCTSVTLFHKLIIRGKLTNLFSEWKVGWFCRW